jgi:hypothetical protein
MKRLILLIIFVTFITFTKNGLESSYGVTVIGSQEVKYFIFEDSGKFKLAELDGKGGYTSREVYPTKENPLILFSNSGNTKFIIDAITKNKEGKLIVSERIEIKDRETKKFINADRQSVASKVIDRVVMYNDRGFWIEEKKGWRLIKDKENINSYQASITQVSGEQGQTLWKLSISNPQNPLEIFGYKLAGGSQATINFYTDGAIEIVSKQSTLTLERGSTDKITLGENGSIKFNKEGRFEVKSAQ